MKIYTAVFVIALLLGGGIAGCENSRVSERTEVKDRIGGGHEVERTRVTETDDKVRVEKEETEIGRHGNIKEHEKSVTEQKKAN